MENWKSPRSDGRTLSTYIACRSKFSMCNSRSKATIPGQCQHRSIHVFCKDSPAVGHVVAMYRIGMPT